MPLNKRSALTIALLFIAYTCFTQTAGDSLTAAQIIQKAIDSAGGEKLFEQIKNVESITQMVTAKGDTLYFAVKKMNFNKYYVSTMSLGYVNTTTVYNNGAAALEKDTLAQDLRDSFELEDLNLSSYISNNYGFKKLGYKLDRQPDQKFKNFDCYCVLVTSPLGKATLNYYDKKTGNEIMVIFPNETRSVFINFYKSNGITCPSQILMVDKTGAVTTSTLKKLIYDVNMDSNWFAVPTPGKYIAPQTFRKGTFKYLNSNDGATIVRQQNLQLEINGESKTEFKIEWLTDKDYLLYRLKNPASPPTNENIEYLKVRIISWANNKYYCQYITSGNIGGTCAFEKIE